MGKSLNLLCTSCNAQIAIPEHLSAVFCSQCGTRHEIIREGGIVALRANRNLSQEKETFLSQFESPEDQECFKCGATYSSDLLACPECGLRRLSDFSVESTENTEPQEPIVREPAKSDSGGFIEKESSVRVVEENYVEVKIVGDVKPAPVHPPPSILPGTGSHSQLCHRCDRMAFDQCKNDQNYFCQQHGRQGYCNFCLDQSRIHSPIGVRIITIFFYVVTGLIVLGETILVFGGAYQLTQLPPTVYFLLSFLGERATNEAIFSLGAIAVPICLGMVGIPLVMYYFGRTFDRGALLPTILVVLGSLGVLFSPESSDFGRIFGLVFLLLMIKEHHWYRMIWIRRATRY